MIEIPCDMKLIVGNQTYELFSGTLIDLDCYFEYTDMFNRKFRLKLVTNENIKFPFIIEPVFDGDKK